MKRRNDFLLISNIKYDYVMGIKSQLPLFLPLVIIAVYYCLKLQTELRTGPTVSFENLGFWDYCIYYFKGICTIDRLAENERLIIPVLYLFPNIYMSFIISKYPESNLKQSGLQVITRTGRKKWWLSKLLWSAEITVVYFVLLAAVFALFGKFDITSVNVAAHERLSELTLSSFSKGHLVISALLLPFAASLALNTAILLISVVLKPFFSMVASCVILVSSVYYCSPFLIGNHFMLLRSEINRSFEGGIPPTKSLLTDAVVIIIMAVLGNYCIKKKDILN